MGKTIKIIQIVFWIKFFFAVVGLGVDGLVEERILLHGLPSCGMRGTNSEYNIHHTAREIQWPAQRDITQYLMILSATPQHIIRAGTDVNGSACGVYYRTKHIFR